MADFNFIPTMEVAHIGNLKQKLYVTKILWKTREQSTGNINDNGKGFEKERGMFLEGIEVEWWYNGDKRKEGFHSGVLVPWLIALQGKDKSEEWRYDHNIKIFKKIELELNKK